MGSIGIFFFFNLWGGEFLGGFVDVVFCWIFQWVWLM